jgi:asparagine synthetase B (glutamine-hydrolysing)
MTTISASWSCSATGRTTKAGKSFEPVLIGGWGPGAREAVERAASRLEFEVAHDGSLSLATQAGSVVVGEAGGCRLWVTGRLERPQGFDHLPPTETGEGSAVQAAALAFDRLGHGAHARLHGAYLLVLRDRARHVVRLAHDHLGARTLNYARSGPDFFFAEHIVDLLTLLPATPAPDRLAVVQWIDRRSLPLGRSLFSGITRLPAGQAIEISHAGVKVREFWRPVFREPAPLSQDECSQTIVAAAFAAVSRAAEDLRRPGIKLSGGLDSACVAAGLRAASGGRRPLAFGRTFPDYPETDETGLIEQTANRTGLELIELPYAETPIFPPVLDYIRRWMLPPGSPHTALWQPLMARALASGVDGMLDGEGGDEIFGMVPFLIADRLRSGRLLAAWRLAGRIPGLGALPAPSMRLRALRVFGVSGAIPRSVHRLRARRRDARDRFGPLVQERDIPGLLAQDEQWSWKEGAGPLWWRSLVDELLDGRERFDANGELARDALDAGLDRRHPFLHDARLVEAVLTIPPEHQFDPVRDRPLLRDGLLGAVPEAVRTRHVKTFFTDITTRPLAGREGAELLERLASPAAPIREYVRAEGLAGLAAISTTEGPTRRRLAGSLFRAASVDAWLWRLMSSAA